MLLTVDQCLAGIGESGSQVVLDMLASSKVMDRAIAGEWRGVVT
jgi:hypothetical protein